MYLLFHTFVVPVDNKVQCRDATRTTHRRKVIRGAWGKQLIARYLPPFFCSLISWEASFCQSNKIHTKQRFFYWFIFCMQNYTQLHKTMNEEKGYYQLSIHPTRINYYYTPFVRRHKNPLHGLFDENINSEAGRLESSRNSMASNQPEQFRDNHHHGQVSDITKRKIARAIDYLVYMARPKRLPYTKHGKGLLFRLNFITLTLSSSQIHTDNEIMSGIFRPFLMALSRKWKVNNYIWRAEKQVNGSIHYHIITDKFIPWNELRNVWNRCQQNLGYVTRYRENQVLWHREGFRFRPELSPKWNRSAQLKAYHEGCRHDWNSPNSTDVHSLRLLSNVKAYFVKYMTKSEQSADIQGRLWGCSRQLTRISGARVAVYNRIDDDLRKIKPSATVKIFTGDYYTTILITILILTQLGCTSILEEWYEYVTDKFSVYGVQRLLL